MKDLIKSLKKFIELNEDQKELIISALQVLRTDEIEEVTVSLPDSTDRQIAKEYVSRLRFNIPSYLYSNINWNQVYSALEREGLIRRVDDVITMKFTK